MKHGKRYVLGSVMAVSTWLFMATVVTAGEIKKADNQDALSADSIWVGKRDGSPVIALPLDNGDGARRYRIGEIMVKDK